MKGVGFPSYLPVLLYKLWQVLQYNEGSQLEQPKTQVNVPNTILAACQLIPVSPHCIIDTSFLNIILLGSEMGNDDGKNMITYGPDFGSNKSCS